MNLHLQHVELPLAHYALTVDATLRGRVTAIYGASGSGKTSLLEVIAGLRRPRRGRVQLEDHVMTDAAARRYLPPESRRIGYVPQDGALFPHLSVRGNLRYSPHARRGADPKLGFDHVIEVLQVERLLDRAVATLSGGEKQRVALGRALLAGPRLLLLDEPLAGIDDPLKERLLPYLRTVRDEFGIPMLYVTHSADEVMALCDEVLLLDRGRVQAQAAPAELFGLDARPRFRLMGGEAGRGD